MCNCNQFRNSVNLVCTIHRYTRKGFREESIEQPEKCPYCQNKLVDIGSKIPIPGKFNSKAWKNLEKLISEKKYFSVCQC